MTDEVNYDCMIFKTDDEIIIGLIDVDTENSNNTLMYNIYSPMNIIIDNDIFYVQGLCYGLGDKKGTLNLLKSTVTQIFNPSPQIFDRYISLIEKNDESDTGFDSTHYGSGTIQ